jgi:sugar phosphate isomerase/epimerase
VKPAVSTAVFDGYPLEVALDEIAALGLRSVEPAYIRGYTEFDEGSFSQGSARRLHRALFDRGLLVQGVSAHISLAGDEAHDMLARRIDFASQLGARILITNAGPASGRAAILRCLEAALPALERADVVLSLENPGHGTGDLIGTGQDGAALIASIGSPSIRLNVDVGNYYTYTGSLEPGLSAALPFAAHAHLKDIGEEASDWRFVPISDGLVDWPLIAAELARHSPGLPLAIELPLRLRRPARGDPARAAERVSLPQIRDAIRRSLDAWAQVTLQEPGLAAH